MRILADENLNAVFIKYLREEGYDVLSIRETYGGIPDYEVAILADNLTSILITEDKDFGELIFAHKITKITIIFLRYHKTEMETVGKQLLQVVSLLQNKEGHFFITIARGKVRISEL